MKKFLLILSLIVCFVFYSFREKGSVHYGKYFNDTIPIVNRTNNSLYVKDGRVYGGLNFNPPTYDDTTAANAGTNLGNDYDGAIIYSKAQHWYFGRINHVWYPFASPGSAVLIPTCGIPNGSHLITWDSLLVFDDTGGPFVSCCDGIPRFFNPSVIVLQAANDSLPRIDAIVSTITGDSAISGIPNANPAVPQIDSCWKVLTYVLINAGQTVPAFVSQNNPLIIYDEFTQYEWDSLFRHNVSVDSLNTSFPIHLLNASLVNGYTIGNNYFEFYTDSTINLLDYGALKFYVRPNDGSTLRLNITWYLDDVPQTNIVQTTIPAGSGVYHTIVLSTAQWNVVGTSSLVNKIRITIQAGGAAGFYLDWMQLQMGIPPPASQTGITTFNAGNLNPLFNTQVSNPTTAPSLSFIQQSAPAYTVLGNETNTLGAYSFGKVDLAHTVTGLLSIINLAPSSSDGDFVSTVGGISSWVTVPPDTILAGNWLRLHPDGNGNDSLFFGDSQPDSALLRFETYVNLNSFPFHIWQNGGDLFKIDPVSFQSILDANDGTADVFIELDGSLTGQVQFTLAAQNGTGIQASLIGDGKVGTILVSGRFELKQGANVGSTGDLTLGNDGNIFHITGTNTINAITSTDWAAGSEITLIFDASLTVKNNTSGGAGTAKMLLAGGSDFSATANDVLTLVFDSNNWIEKSRSVN